MLRHTLLYLLLSLSASAHTDISEIIHGLSEKIAQEPSSELYLQRALEYRALREKQHAIEDLQAALQLQPHHHLAITSLIQLSAAASPEKLALIKRYAGFAHGHTQQLEATYLLAQYYAEAQFPTVSLLLCQGLQKYRLNDKNPALDLLHSQVLSSLGKHSQAATILKKAWERTNSIVLRNNWIDAALTAGLTRDCLPIIEQELATSRFLSSWLIRRARAALIHRDTVRAHADLRRALAEISTRLRPDQPDLTLIADQALALALLGQHAPARSHLRQLKNSSLPPSTYRLLQDTLQPR